MVCICIRGHPCYVFDLQYLIMSRYSTDSKSALARLVKFWIGSLLTHLVENGGISLKYMFLSMERPTLDLLGTYEQMGLLVTYVVLFQTLRIIGISLSYYIGDM